MGRPCCPHQILQVLSNRLFIAKIVMLLHQAVEQRLLRVRRTCSNSSGCSLRNAIFDGSLIDQHRLRPGSVCQRIMPHITDRRQRDLPGPLQHQQHAAAYHVAQRAIRLPPLPGFAYSRPTACGGFPSDTARSACVYRGCLPDGSPARDIGTLPLPSSMKQSFLGTQGGNDDFLDSYSSSLTRRHIGAARTRDTSPGHHQQLGFVSLQLVWPLSSIPATT